jgi:hypothetical protein
MGFRLPHATVHYDSPEKLLKRQDLQCNTQFKSPLNSELDMYEMEAIKKKGYDVP